MLNPAAVYNPFAAMIDPGAVAAACDISDALRQLSRRVYLLHDEPAEEEADDKRTVDKQFEDEPVEVPVEKAPAMESRNRTYLVKELPIREHNVLTAANFVVPASWPPTA